MLDSSAARDELLTIKEASQQLTNATGKNFSEYVVRACIRDGEIGHTRLGNRRGRLFVRHSQITDYLQQRTVNVQAQAA